MLETARVLARVPAGRAASARAALQEISPALGLLPIDLSLIEPLARPFAMEPVRTLDGIHLCSALGLREPTEVAGLLALDDRVRRNAEALGFVVLPKS